MKALTAVILAAGDSKRMRSKLPKALHRVSGRPLVDYPVRLSRALGARVVLVIGHGASEVRAAVGDAKDLAYVEQKERLGTGHAVLRAHGACVEGAILVLPGDQPLMSQDMIQAIVEHHGKTGAAATLLTAELPDATCDGRVIREGGRPVGIVEHRDATPAQLDIHEVGTSVYCFDAKSLWPALGQVVPQNEQGEYYLTDVIGILARSGATVEAVKATDPRECLGINDRSQLAEVASILRRRTLERLLREGVTILDPAATYADDTVGPEANVGAGAITCNYDGVHKHETIIGAGAFVGTNSSLVAPVTIGEGAYVGAGSVITKDVPPGALAVARGKQAIREGWAARKQKGPKGKTRGKA